MKKALSIVLVLVLALSMSTVAFAKAKITDIGNPWWTVEVPEYFGDDATIPVWDVENTDEDRNYHNDGNILFIPIDGTIADSTVWTVEDNAAEPDAYVTKNVVKSSNMTVKLKASKGGQVIDEVEFVYTNVGTAGEDDYVRDVLKGVNVKFVDPFKSNNPDGVNYGIRVYLTLGSKFTTYKDAIYFEGAYINDTDTDIGSGTDYYQFYDYRILKPDVFVRNLEGDLGEGVSVFMRALKGGKYWAYANTDTSDADADIMYKYNSIDAVYHVEQLGLTNVVDYVALNDADPAAYVYDGDLNYLGRANSKLPLAATYYVSAIELDIDDADEPDDGDEGDEDWDYDENSEGGGDDLYPSNPHDNPGTGK